MLVLFDGYSAYDFQEFISLQLGWRIVGHVLCIYVCVYERLVDNIQWQILIDNFTFFTDVRKLKPINSRKVIFTCLSNENFLYPSVVSSETSLKISCMLPNLNKFTQFPILDVMLKALIKDKIGVFSPIIEDWFFFVEGLVEMSSTCTIAKLFKGDNFLFTWFYHTGVERKHCIEPVLVKIFYRIRIMRITRTCIKGFTLLNLKTVIRFLIFFIRIFFNFTDTPKWVLGDWVMVVRMRVAATSCLFI